MMSIDFYKESSNSDVNYVIEQGASLFMPSSNFVSVVEITPDFNFWGNSSVKVENDSSIYLLKDVIESHENLYFERIKLKNNYNKDEVRAMFFALRRLKDKLIKIKNAENVCSALSVLGATDGAKKTLSAVGKYFVNEIRLSDSALTKFQTSNRTEFNLDSFVEFKEAYMLSYTEAREQFEEEKKEKSLNRRYSKNAVALSYNGDVEELVSWIKNNMEYIQVKVPVVTVEDYEQFICGGKKKIQKSIAEIKEKVQESTDELISEARERGLVAENFETTEGQGLYSAWILKLRPEAKSTMPLAVETWMFQKKQVGSLDDYAEGLVYREKQHIITGNPIVKDLVFGYGLKLGKNN